MSETVIQVENVSKLYHLGERGTRSFKNDLQQWWNKTVLKKEDPFFHSINEIIREEEGEEITAYEKHRSSRIWALNQISLDIKRGQVWGIVGDNGSGKSTLLKIISRTILPTHGVVRGKGRVSSLLEIGAGFHNELSGRENIYMSGYILGMKRHEIQKRFAEIVEFSGIEPFIDTPVKRYSSGMYVRLAFAVAAHLDSDILLLDEVLSVGDATFQKKCLNKIQEFALQEDRTILMVSHNAQAVSQLCQQAVWLDQGKVKAIGPMQSVLNQYQPMLPDQALTLRQSWSTVDDAPGGEAVRIRSIELKPHLSDWRAVIDVRTPLTIKFQLYITQPELRLLTGIHLFTGSGDILLNVMSPFDKFERGIVEGECTIPGDFLNDGSYYISLIIYNDQWEELYYHRSALTFDVKDYRGEEMDFEGKWAGVIRPISLLPVRLTQL